MHFRILPAAVLCTAAALAISPAQAQAPAAAGAQAPAAAAPRTPRPPPPPPAADLSGEWIPAAETAAPNPTVIVLKQTAAGDLTGELKPGRTLPGLPPIMLTGAIQGSQMDVMSWFPYQGGELVHLRAEYKDGRLVGTFGSIHSAPNKWRLDTSNAAEYVRRP